MYKRQVQHLAGAIGPRHATSPAYRRAARWVEGELSSRGYDVRRQTVEVPGGNSWGVAVTAGTSQNVIATPPGFDPRQPHLVVGAHLDTVPQAPGAEDNASGVGVVLAVAEALQERRTRLPVMLVAFGAEEPRGDTDADHHYGSRAYVARRLADAGADLVAGGHPHWVQGLERAGDAVVAHSLGNYLFDMDFMEQTMEGVVLTATFWGDRMMGVELTPYRMDAAFTPRPAAPDMAANILGDVWTNSFGPFRSP